MDGQDSRILLGILVVLLFGAGVGLVNGLVITKLRVNAFIATLGMALILRGYVESEYAGPVTGVPEGFQDLGFESWGPIPISVVLLLAVVAGAWFLLRYSRFGNRLYAVGGDEDVAKLSASAPTVIIMAHVLCAVAAAITGLFIASRLGAGSPTIATEVRPRVDRGGRARRHLPARRPRRGARHPRGRLHPRDARQHLQPARGQRVRQGRRPRRDHHRRGGGLLGAVDRRRREEAQAATGQTPGPEPAVGGAAPSTPGTPARSRRASTSARSGSRPAWPGRGASRSSGCS